MPLPLIGALAAGANLLGNLFSNVSQAKQNDLSRQWQERMYGIQRQDALADWQRNADYNSPKAQMERFGEAGLNPNLIYGQASNEAPSVRSSSIGNWNPQAADWNNMGNFVTGSLMAGQDIQIKAAQTNNLEEQNKLLVAEYALKLAQVDQVVANTENIKSRTSSGNFDMQLRSDLRDTTIEMAKENLRRLRTGTDVMLNDNERKQAMHGRNLIESAERVLNYRMSRSKDAVDIRRMKAQINNLYKDSELKQADINLKSAGIQPGDPIWTRVLTQMLNNGKLPGAIGEAAEGAKKWVDKNVSPSVRNAVTKGVKNALIPAY